MDKKVRGLFCATSKLVNNTLFFFCVPRMIQKFKKCVMNPTLSVMEEKRKTFCRTFAWLLLENKFFSYGI